MFDHSIIRKAHSAFQDTGASHIPDDKAREKVRIAYFHIKRNSPTRREFEQHLQKLRDEGSQDARATLDHAWRIRGLMENFANGHPLPKESLGIALSCFSLMAAWAAAQQCRQSAAQRANNEKPRYRRPIPAYA